MMQSEYSLSLDAVICRRCNAVSPAVNDTCPSCGADRQGAIFTSVTDQDAAAAPAEHPRDFTDLRDTGWLTRLARRKMVTSYPSLVEPGDALASPERRPARKGLAALVGGVVAGIAAGGYFYAQMDTRSASSPSVTVAGAIGNGASMPRDHGDADRPALDRHRTDDTAAQADRRDGPRVASASASSGAAFGRAASTPATAAVVATTPSAPPSKPVAEIRVPAMANESPKTRDASRRAVADAIDLAAKRDAAPPNTATGAVVSQMPSHAMTTAASQPASGVAPQSAQSAMSVASALSGSAAPRAMARATPETRVDAPTARIAPATPATSALAGSASSATGAATVAEPTSMTASTKPAAHAASPLASSGAATKTVTASAPPAAVPTLATQGTVVASQSATVPAQTAPRATSATATSSPAAPKPTMPGAPQTVARADQATQERSHQPDTDKSTAASTQEAPSPAEARIIAAVRQALASRDLATARRHLRGLTATQSRSPQIQQLAADVSRQERARDGAMANARSCAASHNPACAVRNARRAVALDPRNPQAQATLKQAMTVQSDANTAYFRQASALPGPAVPSMTFDGRWSVGSKTASASGARSDATGAYTLFGWGVPTVSKGRGDAH